jgi:hypothetical protein
MGVVQMGTFHSTMLHIAACRMVADRRLIDTLTYLYPYHPYASPFGTVKWVTLTHCYGDSYAE